MKAKINSNKNEHPCYYPACQVPFVFREKVEEQLKQLQAPGTIQPVQFTDWAAPIFPMAKSDICILMWPLQDHCEPSCETQVVSNPQH